MMMTNNHSKDLSEIALKLLLGREMRVYREGQKQNGLSEIMDVTF